MGRAGQPCRATQASPLRINPLSGMTGPGSGFGERRLTTAGDSVETKIGQEARSNRAYEVQAGGPTGNGSVLG